MDIRVRTRMLSDFSAVNKDLKLTPSSVKNKLSPRKLGHNENVVRSQDSKALQSHCQ